MLRENQNSFPQFEETQDLEVLIGKLKDTIYAVMCIKLFFARKQQAENAEDSLVALVFRPSGAIDVCPQGECQGFDSEDIVCDDRLYIRYRSKDVISYGGCRYLLGSVMAIEMDEYGNDASVTDDTIAAALDFMDDNMVGIILDDEWIPAFRIAD